MFAVVFDMDGVLVDSEIHWKKMESAFLRGLLPEWDEARQKSIIGMSVYDVYSLLIRDYGLCISREEYLEYYDHLAGKLYGELSGLIPGAEEIIRELSVRNFPLGLASSSPRRWMDIVLDRFSFAPYFNAVVSSDDVRGCGKPEPDIYLLACSKLGIAPEYAAAIEDTEKGVRSAKSAGMKCVGLRNGFNEHQDLSMADYIAWGFADIPVERITGLLRT